MYGEQVLCVILNSFVMFSYTLPNTMGLDENTLVKFNSHHSQHSHALVKENLTDFPENIDTGDSETRNSTNILQFLVSTSYNIGDTTNNKIIKEQSETSTKCQNGDGCAKEQLINNLPKDSLKAMRLNHIKQQILKKLNLKEPPKTSNMPIYQLPSALTRELAGKSHHDRYEQDEEDFFGHTEEVIVFLEDARRNCLTNQTDPHLCLTFKIPEELDHKKVSHAELWIYKMASSHSNVDHTFWIGKFPESKIIETYNATITEGWLKLNISNDVRIWNEIGKSESGHPKASRARFHISHNLQIGCKTCRMSSAYDFPFDVITQVNKPFVVIHIAPESMKKRSRRNTNCSPTFSECCREQFTVKFRDLGWDDWIIAPQQYEAYYCKGSCVNINGITHSKARHTSIMQRYVQIDGAENRVDLVPCCSASRLSGLQLLYRNENTTINKVLPNMVVESCGCL